MLVVLCAALPLHLQTRRFQVVEFFAGSRRIARLARSIGLRSAAHDILYDETEDPETSAMNINTCSGFMLASKFLGQMSNVPYEVRNTKD